ncbi:TPA: hypothetical protein P6O34_002664 [Staphylococcus aureus]|nr:hypothetical protein [Staphylococcus aureus]HDP4186734.1 hypothetical protein [Staphylococcus aureus]HDP4192073.1 hypothetical protein [Staphylococcus aureus]
MVIYKVFDGNADSDENSVYIKESLSILSELKYLIGDINAYSFVDMYEALQGSKKKEWLTPQETINTINHFYDVNLEYTQENNDFIPIDIYKEMDFVLQKYKRSSNKFNDPNIFSNIRFKPFTINNIENFIVNMFIEEDIQDYFDYLEQKSTIEDE